MPVRSDCCDDGGLAGGDHFAPKYLIGNVPNGDPAVAQTGAFRYIPDPGDGTGIALAITESTAAPGDIWVRPGTYTWTGADRLIVPANRTIRGAGRGLTLIINNNDAAGDNTMFELAAGAELSQMSITKGATLGAKGTALVAITAVGARVWDFEFDLSAAATAGSLTSGIQLSNSASKRHSIIRDGVITLPNGAGGAVATWMAGIRGTTVLITPHVCSVENVVVFAGDAAVLTLGVEMLLDAVFAIGPKGTGFYADNARLSATARQCIVELTKGGELGGCVLLQSTFIMQGARFSSSNAQAIPAILVSGDTGTAVADVVDNEIGANFNPAILIGTAAEVCNDCRVVDNRISLGANAVPVAIGTGADNTSVKNNISRGSGSIPATDLGTGSDIAGNIWGV